MSFTNPNVDIIKNKKLFIFKRRSKYFDFGTMNDFFLCFLILYFNPLLYI